MSEPHRYQQREKLINDEEFLTGFYTNENYCQRMKKHIQKMKVLQGDHLQDIQTYINLMTEAECNNIPSGGSRRRASKKHKKSRSKKSKKSKKSRRSRRSRKTKSRRH